MKEITPMELDRLIHEKRELNIIDVREIDELADGKIPEAIHIPLGQIEAYLHQLDPTLEYIMVCRSGGRSGQATQLLLKAGFQGINMQGGMLAWTGETEKTF